MAKAHARHSPSKLDSLSRCLRFKYKERTDDAADEGTMLHEACETGNLAGLNEEQRTAVELARGYADSLIATDGGPSEWLVLKEVKLYLADLTYGHADFVAIHKTLPIAHVLDFKFTRVEGNHAFQLQAYGAALVSMVNDEGLTEFVCEDGTKHPHPGHLLEKVTTHVCAPRLHEPYVAEYNATDLLRVVTKEIENLYVRLDDPFLEPTPHADLCSNCARADKCPKMNQVVLHVSRAIGLPMPEVFSLDGPATEKDRAIAQVLKGALENWCEQISKNNSEYVRAGGEIPGFKMQSRSTGLKLAEGATVSQAVEALIASGNFTHDDIMEATKLSFAQLAEHKAETSTMKKAEAAEAIQVALGEMVVQGSCSFLTKVKRTPDAELVRQLVQ